MVCRINWYAQTIQTTLHKFRMVVYRLMANSYEVEGDGLSVEYVLIRLPNIMLFVGCKILGSKGMFVVAIGQDVRVGARTVVLTFQAVLQPS